MLNFKNLYVFILSLVLNLLIMLIINKFIITESFYFNNLIDKYEFSKINEIIAVNKKIEWITYVIFPLIYLFKILTLSIVLFIGINYFEIKIYFKDCFKIILLGELVPLSLSLIKTLYFYIYPPTSIDSLQNFNPLGLSALLNNGTIPKYFLYPIQQLNLFEVAYWLLLAYGIMTIGNIGFKKALQITSLSYGVGLAIWCIFIVFIQLQFS